MSEFKVEYVVWKYFESFYEGCIHLLPLCEVNGFKFIFTRDNLCWYHPESKYTKDETFIDALNVASEQHEIFKRVCEFGDLSSRIFDDDYDPGHSVQEILINLANVKYPKDSAYEDYQRWKWIESENVYSMPSDQWFLEALRQHSHINFGYIYLVQSPSGYFKIGKAKNVNNRLQTFEVKLPFEIELLHTIECRDYSAAERFLHARYAAERVNGSEFFSLSAAQVDEIKQIEEM